MSYLISTLEQIDKFFVKEPYNADSPFSGGIIHLPKTEKVIVDAWKTYEVERSGGEDFEKIPLNHTKYDKNNKNHYQEFRVSYLSKHLNISDFEDDIKQNISEDSRIFLKDFDVKLLKLSTELQIKHEVNKLLEKIENSIESLQHLKANQYQKIIIETYLNSYKKTLTYLSDKYGVYMPEIKPDEDLSNYIIHSKIRNLQLFEKELINRNFIIKSENELYWDKEKVKLVNFCRLLEHHKYNFSHISITEIIRFFEKRYNIKTGDQSKPSKFNGTISQIQIDFFFLKL